MTQRTHCCDQMHQVLKSGETGLSYYPKFREYGIDVLDGTSSHICIGHCPWCGRPLPAPLRHRWFDEIEALGLSFPEDEADIPTEFLDERWFIARGL